MRPSLASTSTVRTMLPERDKAAPAQPNPPAMFAEIPSRSRLEEAVLRPWKAEILPQRRAFIFLPEQPAPLQLRDHAVDEVVQPLRQIGEHDVEAVATAAHQPFLHLVGNQLWRAHEGKAREGADALGELAHGKLVACRDSDEAFAAGLARIAF